MMKDYIQSKDYRKFLEENHIVLSDWDKATLIYQAFGMSHYDKILALLEIKNRQEISVYRFRSRNDWTEITGFMKSIRNAMEMLITDCQSF